jgi:Tol biopolymer transport system component
MGALESRALEGTDGAFLPFWSPDGQYLGFFQQGKLKKIPAAGGLVQTLCDVPNARGGSWSRDGIILFSPGPSAPLFRVSSSGGEAVPVTSLGDGGTEGHRFPAFLPDGRHFLFTRASDKPDAAGLYWGSLDGSAPVRLTPDETNGLYAPPAVTGDAGFLLFRRETTLMAQPFDAATRQTTGDMFPIADGVVLSAGLIALGAFSVAANGTLIFRVGGPADRELVWVDRAGKRLAVVGRPGAIRTPYSLSPDDTKVAVSIVAGQSTDIWIHDLSRAVLARLTFRAGINRNPVWSPDGSEVVYSFRASGGETRGLYRKLASGTGNEESVLAGGINVYATDWSADNKLLAYQQDGTGTGVDVSLLPLDGPGQPVTYLQSPANESAGRFSPALEGNPLWLAYQSNESGRNEIYVQAVPATGAKYQISTSGGGAPRWRRDGKELYYLGPEQALMAVPMALGSSLQVGTPARLFSIAGMTYFAASQKGDRFLVNLPAGEVVAPPMTVVTNWQAGLRK